MATERFGARSAPGGLALVQELVNTHAVRRNGEDLLAGRASAQRWLDLAAGQWGEARGLTSPDPALAEADLPALRDLRSVVIEMLAVPGDQRPEGMPVGAEVQATVNLVADDAGRVGIEPVGTGGRWLTSAVWSEVLLSQQTGTWSRLKLCREPGCRSAFYDTSRNRSGVWHNVQTCGNITNLRASRTRKRVREQ
jgi:predicted RNA-binding Zn ribbon-like protein